MNLLIQHTHMYYLTAKSSILLIPHISNRFSWNKISKKKYYEYLGLHYRRDLDFILIFNKNYSKIVFTSGDRDFSSEQVSKWLTFSTFFTLLSIIVLVCKIFEAYIQVYFGHQIVPKLLFSAIFHFAPIMEEKQLYLW